MSFKEQKLKANAAIIFACLLWGTTGTAASFTPSVSPLATGAFAMGLGGLLLVFTSLKHLKIDSVKLLSHYPLLIVGGLSVAVYPLAFYSSMRLSGVAIGTVVSLASAPFFTVLLECLISNKSVAKKWFISFAIGALGIVLLSMGKLDDIQQQTQNLHHYFGITLGLLAGLSYALYSWVAKSMIDRNIHSKSAMAAMFGLAALILLPSLFVTGDNLFASTSNTFVAFYMAIIPMFLGYVLFGYGLNYVEASQATLLTLLEPALATIMAVVIVGEKFSVIGWLGIGLILLCLLLQLTNKPSIPQPQAAI
ncbi:EamA family transporter [uncultured Paraglaciecola sp.]|uniref:DMT family transporter n=1 Tax=uncultured Paraglaciecola sp. TaxID=1765024 RepID=UPI0030D9B4B3